MAEATLGRTLAAEIAHARALIAAARDGRTETWQAVLAFADVWSLRHSSVHSVADMDDRGLQQSVVEDILFATTERMRGAQGIYGHRQALRHIGDLPYRERAMQGNRIMAALQAAAVSGLVVKGAEGYFVPTSRLDEAQRYCGVYILDEGCSRGDIFDDLQTVGGLELVSEVFDELVADVDRLNPPGCR